MPSKAKNHQFRAETRKVLNILTHSLYTNREIFLRELLSNASDALDKLRYLQSKGETVRDPDLPLEITLTIDKVQGILQIADTGVGMTEKEMVDNLGTIARSGSEQFLRELEDEEIPVDMQDKEEADDSEADTAGEEKLSNMSASQIIGRFGIGFYSVFMVADEVEVISVPALPAEEGEPAHIWKSQGEGSFSIRTLDGEEAQEYKRGTVIRAKLKDDAKDFLEKYRLESVIRAHSNFLPFPILLEGERINTTPALWREPKFSITPEQYADFYKYLTYDDKAPLDVIHLSVDAPVQFNALLFIPDSVQDYFGEQKDSWGLDLYVRRVLIERSNSELIPNYLAFLKGVVDTEDLPLNISRETLQENVVLRKISQTIIKQVLNHLERMAQSAPDKYENFWKLHGRYFKFAFNDFMNRDRITPLLRFTSSAMSEDKLTSLDDYISRMRPDQKEIWYVTAPTREAARVNPYMEPFRRKGIEVLYLLEAVDELALDSVQKYKDHPFKSVEQMESKDLEDFEDTEETKPAPTPLSETEATEFSHLLEAIKAILGDNVQDVRVSERLSGSPAVLATPDGMSSSMEKLMRVMQKNEGIPKKVLEVNRDHPLMRDLLKIYTANKEDPLVATIINSLFDNLLLMDGYLNEPYVMADRTIKLMEEAASWYTDIRKL